MTVRTLATAEMSRIRAELFDNVLAGGALPYVAVGTIYDVIASNVESSATDPTSSSTAVNDAGPTVLTLASVTGLSVGTRVVLDVDDAREVVTVRAIVGSTISVVCTKTHAGTYPVEIESPLTIVRGLLADLETVDQQQRTGVANLGVKKVDGEIEFFAASEGSTLTSSETYRNRLRSRLAAATGLTRLFAEAAARAQAGAQGTGDCEAY